MQNKSKHLKEIALFYRNRMKDKNIENSLKFKQKQELESMNLAKQ